MQVFKKSFYLFAAIPMLLLVWSCGSVKKTVYFNDLTTNTSIDTSIISPIILIQSGDILQITISTIDREITALLNPITSTNPNAVNSSIAIGYLVDKQGSIELPMTGRLNVAGKSIEEINEQIKKELSKSVKNAYVSTRLLNFKISVLGDVARPGSYSISNERVSILEALSLAGDANITAIRDDIVLIREFSGKKRYISINLNDSKILSSPYYYLANNDVVYVKPGTSRKLGNSVGLQLLPTILGTVSFLISVGLLVLRK